MPEINLYAIERLLLALAIKQKQIFKNIRPHWFFGLGAKITFFSIKPVIFIFGLFNYYFWVPCPKIHIGMYFHKSNIISTNVIKEKWSTLDCQMQNLRVQKN